jgi:hypothetical protein
MPYQDDPNIGNDVRQRSTTSGPLQASYVPPPPHALMNHLAHWEASSAHAKSSTFSKNPLS